ncbi:ABC transporter ATP-binding protein/permease [Halobacillus sp. A1]|uniref:ABC transporter ATP-binding protein n=1 Tax=Halobacillus sp. A1 TaxID=2880262 RepID=UPI0020A65094|nr:ABC transporter ATP-binding protein [Halobacillus sp. A1]MCP3030058.1 ABC transporter ATP-binding protein/permease [Halobacillus sp. A1]
MKTSLKKLLMLFDKKEKRKFLILFAMMIVAAIFETVGIGLIVPFVTIATNPEQIHEHAVFSYVSELFNLQTYNSFIILAVGVLLFVFVIKNLYLLLFQYAQFRIILNQQVSLSRQLFQEYLKKPYTFHLKRNTADLLRNVNSEVPKVFQGIILAGFQLFTELLVITCILILLLLTSPIATLTAFTLLGGSVFIFFKLFRKKISSLGKEQQKVDGTMIKWVNQGLGANKVVKVSGKENFFIKAYTGQSQIKANNSRYMKLLEQVPRLFIETLLVSVVLITMVIIVIQGENTTELISTMALFAMAAFRLMPSITRVVAMITTIRYSQPALSVIYEDLFSDKDEHSISLDTQSIAINKKEKAFKESIQLNNVSYRYPGQDILSIKDVTLNIPIGKSVAFVGESGAGKTTLVDIILGLLKPEQGQVMIDGKKLTDQKRLWQQRIGYIPQSIYLSDDTIRRNIAFGVEEESIDDKEVWRALEQAHLKQFVKTLPEQLNTQVGENGVRLSGGQRQRIGIARALYHNPEILFLDEATSALDNGTEKEIMKAIDSLKGDMTLIIIAHRLSTIKNCDIVFEFNNGKLSEEKNTTKSRSLII